MSVQSPEAEVRCAILVSFALLASGVAAAAENFTVAAVPPEVRAEFQLAPFYQKHVNAGGLPVVGSAKVNDAALAECAWIVTQMLQRRPDILRALAEGKVRFAIMAHDEYTTDIPEHAHLKPRVYWDRRARGLGATPRAPAVSGGEENLLAFPGDPYPREIIPMHEFGHAIHEVAMKAIDPTFDERLRDAYRKAIDAGLWKGTYAATNRQEYWAEGVQSWFDNNDFNNALHNDIWTREKLKAYDAALAALCAEVFGDIPWKYQKPADRRPEERAHLAGFDRSKAPRFKWRTEPVPERPRVSLDSPAGNMEFEFSGPREELTRLLEQCIKGYFSGGRAIFTAERIQLTPAEKTPDGAPVPEGEGRWTFAIGSESADALSAKVVKGAAVLADLVKQGEEGVRVQRIVRLN
jgi:hypothetical protein